MWRARYRPAAAWWGPPAHAAGRSRYEQLPDSRWRSHHGWRHQTQPSGHHFRRAPPRHFFQHHPPEVPAQESYPDETELEEQPPSKSESNRQIKAYDQAEAGTPWLGGAGRRFPITSFICLAVILAATIIVIVVLLEAENKDIDTWCPPKIIVSGASCHRYGIRVSTVIAVSSFISVKALAIMFMEGVAISWWVDALAGQRIKNLHYRWKISQSFISGTFRASWSWIVVASFAVTTFAALEALMQMASSSATAFSTSTADMTATLADSLPAGFSGVIAAIGHDEFGTVYFTPPFIDILQNHSSQTPILLDMQGCDTTANASCATTLTGVGFHYTCNASRSALQTPISDSDNGTVSQPENTVFEVTFIEDLQSTWALYMNLAWQDSPGSEGDVIANRNCTLVPALVEYPVNVTQRIVTLQPPNSTVNWTSGKGSVNDSSTYAVDRVLNDLPIPSYDAAVQGSVNLTPGTHSTLGGIALAFQTLFDSSISVKSDVTDSGSEVSITGSFAAAFAHFQSGTGSIDDTLNNTYASPVDSLLSNIRDIMFRSSVAIAAQNITSFARTNSSSNDDGSDHETSEVPAKAVTAQGTYQLYHTVYKTNKTMLGISVTLVLAAVLSILPLFWGFWHLGRKVSLSPIEIAMAFKSAHVDGQSKGQGDAEFLPDYGSNFNAKELVDLLGETDIRYGEIAPNMLGMGLRHYTMAPKEEELCY
ncbi:hypothetical protein EDD37DRAFT_120078 [Exophiala viscosa]|uniref:uncharacterized protein n=1 Tax=Exophiala viscosa TaxID=2486360 RepID=UPI00219C0060|nr:hypothetical protein EDD37DRAFT_120078 [Exophiala viscosa]